MANRVKDHFPAVEMTLDKPERNSLSMQLNERPATCLIMAMIFMIIREFLLVLYVRWRII